MAGNCHLIRLKLWGIWGIIYPFSLNFPMRKRLETLGKTLRFIPKYPKA